MLVAFTLSPAAMARTISSCCSGFNFRFTWIEGLSHCSKRSSTRLIVSSLIPLISVKLPQRVISRSLPIPSTSRIYSSTRFSLSEYLSRRCCLHSSAVCACQFFVPMDIALDCRFTGASLSLSRIELLNALSNNKLAGRGETLNEIDASVLVLKPQVVGILLLSVTDTDKTPRTW
jgi:hypothetical protein